MGKINFFVFYLIVFIGLSCCSSGPGEPAKKEKEQLPIARNLEAQGRQLRENGQKLQAIIINDFEKKEHQDEYE